MRIESGAIVAIRLFTAANEIDLRQAETLWAERTGGIGARNRLDATPAKAVSFVIPPLMLDLGETAAIIAGAAEKLSCSARLYDFGVVALSLRMPAVDISWETFSARIDQFEAAVGPAAEAVIWQQQLAILTGLVGSAFERPVEQPLQEDYLISLVESFDGDVSAEALQAQVDLAPLLSGRSRPLSPGARQDLLRQSFSYYADDLAVITWDRAFLYEPRGETDVADVLELANAQLLEMRAYDELLNAEMPRMRALAEAERPRFSALAGRRYTRLARRLRALVAEITELTERVDNALHVTEDVYLARVYAAAIELLRVPKVGDAVDRKLAIIRETYAALQSEAEGSRAELLEIAVIALIASEILVSLLRR
ncbi:hypothetical protein SAMN05444678_11066 [Sphingomonas sp. YR710]|uniref:hypothetical protein n=1 Tax=Sphingomonas sp. YR710 TaxID=1882773 RepID=UPI00088E6227|nr:hypothetical protein [Sphingomonas sp. YR710]SDD19960.1 hypothetical protein SAMN05444678_11066 [Sphingomonas sp. YR710]